jgi:ketosteroid isomerase-like protein
VTAKKHPNLELLERGVAAFAAHDLVTLSALFSDDLQWHYGGTSELAGDYDGVDAVFALFARRAMMTNETYTFEPDEAVADSCFVTVLAKVSARASGRTYEDRHCVVYRLDGGKVVEAWHHPARPEIEAAFYRGLP